MGLVKWGMFATGVAAAAAVIALLNYDAVSGVYIVKDQNSLMFVQLVRSDKSHVSGRIESVRVRDDGSLQDDAFPFEGTLDQGQLDLKANVLLGFGPTLSGSVSGGSLRLVSTAGQSLLRKSDFGNLATEKARLAAAGASLTHTLELKKVAGDQQKVLATLATEGGHIDDKLPKALSGLEAEANGYLQAVAQKRDGIDRHIAALRQQWGRVSGDDKATIEDDIKDGLNDLSGLKSDFDDKQSELADKYDLIAAQLKSFSDDCVKANRFGKALPVQCNSIGTYLSAYQKSRSSLHNRFQLAESNLRKIS